MVSFSELRGIFYGISAFLILLISVVSTFKFRSDLYTKARVAVSHRRVYPELTENYKRTIYFSMAMLYFHFVHSMLASIDGFAPVDFSCIGQFKVLMTLRIVMFQLGKVSLYLIFILRLEVLYGGTLFAYSPKRIRFSIRSLIVYNVILFVVIFIWSGDENVCQHRMKNFQSPFAYICGAMILLQDVFCAIAFLLAFVVPTRRTLKLLERQDSLMLKEIGQQKRAKFFYSIVKITNLTAVAMISSVVFIVLTLTNFSYLHATDVVINCICVALMTPYYPDTQYYKRLCAICIYVVTPRDARYRREAENYERENEQSSRISLGTETGDTVTETETVVVSLDTHEVPRNVMQTGAATRVGSDSTTIVTG